MTKLDNRKNVSNITNYILIYIQYNNNTVRQKILQKIFSPFLAKDSEICPI